jgi:hypothetical protein
MIPSQSFVETLILLLLTLGLIGVLVPFLFWRIDERKKREQKAFEADLARQGQILDAQVKLVKDLSDLLWEYQLLLVAVPYYRQFPKRNRYPIALNAYEERAGELLVRIRAEISKALHLTPPSLYQELKDLYYNELLQLDLKVSELALGDDRGLDRAAEWQKLNHYAVQELAERVDKLIDRLATELALKARTFENAAGV